ncbi:glutamine amidotransferase [Pelagirhabdus alkalitolerans]|uniref:Imidazole glycerol phosphate synthase subunit HisH n=1 Tax=Pelagirhabdus alkalitolerans TaxID=1612202 RepID=A0A1G6H6U0_9BACI|nr:imidazole glycerol phosphate synthase subunit HisH [Pelagirhabdus alkalitolerans]SDB89931.1 glutamine amidotransferase [Pelagirhabdus alkalitolerans]
MIAIVDYGMGNTKSVQNAFENLGYQTIITDDHQTLREASHIILPGVGSFQAAIEEIERRQLKQLLIELAENKPFLGICLGMQLLFTEGTEGGKTAGLDLIPGTIDRIQTDYLLPHIGWNQLNVTDNLKSFQSFDQEFVYFVHTFQAYTSKRYIVATTEYQTDITAIVNKEHIYGIQFHPEKSGKVGTKIIQAFLKEVEK